MNVAQFTGLSPNANVLAIIVARIGDTLLVTPALRALKAAIPRGTLTVLAHENRADLLANLPFIDRLGVISKRTAWWRGWLPSAKASLAVVWGHDRPLVDYALRRAGTVIAFQSPRLPESEHLIGVPVPESPMHAVRERMLLIDAAGVTQQQLHLSYQVMPDEAAAARQWLTAQKVGKPVIGIQAVSFPTKKHRDWPLDSFASLLRGLTTRFPDAGFVILGDVGSADAGAQLQQAVGAQVVIASGQFTLRQSAALISLLDLYIGVDTGPTHIAGALGVPMVALYHCSYPGRNLVPLEHSALRMIEHPATGLPAASSDQSMAEIPVDLVHCAAVELLERRAL